MILMGVLGDMAEVTCLRICWVGRKCARKKLVKGYLLA
jgi:hypothetical protein